MFNGMRYISWQFSLAVVKRVLEWNTRAHGYAHTCICDLMSLVVIFIIQMARSAPYDF